MWYRFTNSTHLLQCMQRFSLDVPYWFHPVRFHLSSDETILVECAGKLPSKLFNKMPVWRGKPPENLSWIDCCNWFELFDVIWKERLAATGKRFTLLFVSFTELAKFLFRFNLRSHNFHQWGEFQFADKKGFYLSGAHDHSQTYSRLQQEFNHADVWLEVQQNLWTNQDQCASWNRQVELKKVVLYQDEQTYHRWNVISCRSIRSLLQLVDISYNVLPASSVPIPFRFRSAPEKRDSFEIACLTQFSAKLLQEYIANSNELEIERLLIQSQGEQCILYSVRNSFFSLITNLTYRTCFGWQKIWIGSHDSIFPKIGLPILRKKLEKPHHITMLDYHVENGWSVRQVEENAFQPLRNAIQYQVQQVPQIYASSMLEANFEFEPFSYTEVAQGIPTPTHSVRKIRSERLPKTFRDESTKIRSEIADSLPEYKWDLKLKGFDEIEAECHRLQSTLRSIEGAFDHPDRQQLWLPLAILLFQMGKPDQGIICWSQAVWVEAKLPFPAEDLFLENKHVSDQAVHTRVGEICRACLQDTPEKDVTVLYQPLQSIESSLPIRLSWQCWHSLAKASRDLLLLTRVRDRLLNKLFHEGSRIDRDLPYFISTRQSGFQNRISANSLIELLEAANPHLPIQISDTLCLFVLTRSQYVASTGAYQKNALQFLKEYTNLSKKKTASFEIKSWSWVLAAFQFRIEQTSRKESIQTPLSSELTDVYSKSDSELKVLLDSWRKVSRILEPNIRGAIAPTSFGRENPLQVQLEKIRLLPDYISALHAMRALRKTVESDNGRIALSGLYLSLALQGNATEALPILMEFLDLFTKVPFLDYPQWSELVRLLELAVQIAAHHGHYGLAERFLEELQLKLEKQKQPEILAWIIGSLGVQVFGLFTKMGMSRSVEEFYNFLVEKLLKGKTVPQFLTSIPWNRQLYIPALIRLVAGKIYFGSADAFDDIQAMRQDIWNLPSATIELRLRIVRAFIEAVSLLPEEQSFPCMRELLMDGPWYRFNPMEKYELIESALLAFSTDTLLADPRSRRWIDEDEHLIRRKIHQDLEEFVQNVPV